MPHHKATLILSPSPCLNKKWKLAKLKCLILNRLSLLLLRVYYVYILKFPHCIFIILFWFPSLFLFSLNHCTRMCFDHLPNWNTYKNFWSIPIIVNWAVLPRQELGFSLVLSLSLKQKVFPLKIKRKRYFCNIQKQWNKTLQLHRNRQCENSLNSDNLHEENYKEWQLS